MTTVKKLDLMREINSRNDARIRAYTETQKNA